MDSFSSHVEKKGSILWIMFLGEFILLKKRFNSESHVQKGSIIFEWYCWKKVSIPWSKLKKGSISRVTKKFLSWSQIIFKKVQFFESFCEEGSILCLLVKSVQFFESNFENPVQFFESHSKKRVQFCESCSKRMFNSVDQKSVQLSLRKMGSILCVMKKKKVQFFWVTKKGFNSLSHMKRFKRLEFLEWVILVKKGSILRFFWKNFNS